MQIISEVVLGLEWVRFNILHYAGNQIRWTCWSCLAFKKIYASFTSKCSITLASCLNSSCHKIDPSWYQEDSVSINQWIYKCTANRGTFLPNHLPQNHLILVSVRVKTQYLMNQWSVRCCMSHYSCSKCCVAQKYCAWEVSGYLTVILAQAWSPRT